MEEVLDSQYQKEKTSVVSAAWKWEQTGGSGVYLATETKMIAMTEPNRMKRRMTKLII